MAPVVHRNVTESAATISVAGLRRPLKVLHLSDSHVDVGAEPGLEEAAHFMHHVYSQGSQDRATGAVITAAEQLAASLAAGAAAGATVLAHTGDLVNFPSPAAVEAATAAIGQQPRLATRLYTSGNHDWAYGRPSSYEVEDRTGQVVSSAGEWVYAPDCPAEELRAEAQRGVNARLYSGRVPSAWTEEVGGMLFVGIDNSTYQVTAAQHATLKGALAAVAAASTATGNSSPPCGVVLMLHIPLFTPELHASMLAGGRDVTNSLCGNPAAGHGHAPDAETRAFLETVSREGSGLCAVLCGHIHSSQAHRLSGEFLRTRPGERVPYPLHGAMQYVVDAGCYGGRRLLSFEPAPPAQGEQQRSKL